jgi:ubiquinone/menaquinone biosynthesis C-methylase UbiE
LAVNNYRFLSSNRCYHPKILSHGSTSLRHRLWRSFYDRIAFAYDAVLHWADRLHIGSERRVRREVIAGLYLPADSYVMDIGCGTAANLEFLPVNISYIGVDLSANMLRVAKAKSERSVLVQADAVALPFRKDFVLLVIAMGVLQHVVDPQKGLAEMRRVAHQDAQILIIDERHAADRILPAEKPAQARKIGEYFVMSSRKP